MVSNEVADQPNGSGLQHSNAVGDSSFDAKSSDMTLGGLIRRAAEDAGDRIAMVDGVADAARRRRWTYAQLLQQAEQTARALLAGGHGAGSRQSDVSRS